MQTLATVHLVRHGEVHNPDRVLYGRLPEFGLSELGHEMARGVAAWFEERAAQTGRAPAVVAASPLTRAQQTAAPLAIGREHPALVAPDHPLVGVVAAPAVAAPFAVADAVDVGGRVELLGHDPTTVGHPWEGRPLHETQVGDIRPRSGQLVDLLRALRHGSAPWHRAEAGEQQRLGDAHTLELAEADLIAALDAAEPKAAQAVQAEDFEAAIRDLRTRATAADPTDAA